MPGPNLILANDRLELRDALSFQNGQARRFEKKIMRNLFAKKNLTDLVQEADGEHELRRALGPWNLITLGIGAIIGAGIFMITGQAAAHFAGPAIVISFVLAAITCAFRWIVLCGVPTRRVHG